MGVIVHGFRWKLSRMRNEGGAASLLVMNSLPRIVISSEVEKSSLHTGQTKDVGER